MTTTCPDLEELKRYNRDACRHGEELSRRIDAWARNQMTGRHEAHVICSCGADLGTPWLVRAFDHERERKRDAEYATSYPTSKVTP